MKTRWSRVRHEDRGHSGRWLSAPLFLALVVFGAIAGPASQGAAVEGVDRARILAPAGAEIQPYRNVGYRLEWVDDEVFVEVDASPLVSSKGFTWGKSGLTATQTLSPTLQAVFSARCSA